MHVVILITAKDKKQAQKIADKLVANKLIACANIVNNIQSVFRWEGKVDQAKEVLLILKSKRALVRRIVKTVKSVHTYTVPEIIALPIIEGNQDYLKWIDESVGSMV